MMILAIFEAPPAGTEWPFVLNVIAWLGVMTIAATFILTLKKLFGRQPSLSSVLSGLITVAVLKEFKEEQVRRDAGLEAQIAAVHDETDTAFNAAFAREGDRERDIREMRDILSRLQERTETHIRKLDQYDSRFDRLLRRFGSGEQP